MYFVWLGASLGQLSFVDFWSGLHAEFGAKTSGATLPPNAEAVRILDAVENDIGSNNRACVRTYVGQHRKAPFASIVCPVLRK